MVSILIIVLTFLPAVLSFMKLPAKRAGRHTDPNPLFTRFIDKIVDLNLKHQKIVLPIIGAVVVLSLIGIFRIQVETNPVGYLKEGAPVKRNFIDIYQDLSGSFPINIAMAGSEADFFENPKNLADIDRLQEFLDTLKGVDKTLSFADYLKLVNYVLNRFEPEYYRLPEEGFEVRMLLNNFKTILGEDVFSRFMNADLSKTKIILLTHMSSSRKFLQLREKTLAFVKQNFSKDLEWAVTGLGMVIAASSHQLTVGQIKSLGITMILVFGIMFILFMSFKVGLIAILPNLFPIIINFGIMGWLGIELSMVTSLIASIAIGLAVDDTIHYLVRYNREFKKDLDEKRAIRDTLHHVGRPIIFTTITLCAAFSILLFSSFQPTAIFGVMMMITSFDWKMIKRLQWLYPPTAQKFFINLMGITCDRLENLTECFSEIKRKAF